MIIREILLFTLFLYLFWLWELKSTKVVIVVKITFLNSLRWSNDIPKQRSIVSLQPEVVKV